LRELTLTRYGLRYRVHSKEIGQEGIEETRIKEVTVLVFSARAGCRLPQFNAEKFGICLLGERCMLLRITSARVAESDNLLKSFLNLRSTVRWFGKGREPDPWDEDVQEPIGDLEAAKTIRKFCDAASDIARNLRSGFCGSSDRERSARAEKAAMRTALKITDDLIRDAALRRIIDLCVTANNLKAAEVRLRAIQATSIREEVLKEHTVLQR
jgi:hypothetical protein